MTIKRNRLKGTDILQLKFSRIEEEFHEVSKFLDFIDLELKVESNRIEDLLLETNSFESLEDEHSFYSYIESESTSYQNYFPQIIKKYVFVGMFGLFETYFKILIHNAICRIKCKNVNDKQIRLQRITEIKRKINKQPLYNVKTDFISLYKKRENDFIQFEKLWSEISKYKELRNSIIHNDCDVSKSIENHWSKINIDLKTLENLINCYYSDKLIIKDGKFIIDNKDFLRDCERTYINFLDETKKIIINYAA